MISPAREPIERNVGDIAAVNTASDQGAFQSRHFQPLQCQSSGVEADEWVGPAATSPARPPRLWR
jgi:hypothetical protein